MKRITNLLLQRAITALIFVSVLLIPLFAGQVPGFIILGALCILTMAEFSRLQETPIRRSIINMSLAATMYVGICWIVINRGVGLPIHYASYLSLAFGLLLGWRLYHRQNPFEFRFQVLPLTLYVALPIALLFAIANWSGVYRPQWVLGILLFVWTNDTLAYLVGRKWGKRPFSRYISPRKTWEGTIAGWLGCILVAFPVWKLIGTLPFSQWIMIGLVTGVASSVGDLIVSLFKRIKGIKDSGKILPGHGGFMDRIDSLLFAVPFICVLFIICF